MPSKKKQVQALPSIPKELIDQMVRGPIRLDGVQEGTDRTHSGRRAQPSPGLPSIVWMELGPHFGGLLNKYTDFMAPYG